MNSNNKKFIKKIFNQLKKGNNSNKILPNNYQTNPNKKILDSKEKIIPKQKYNIDLFLGVKEQFQNEKSSNNNNNIYLNFYNKHTKNQIQKENKLGKKFLENNKEYIKEKQEKFKIKKEQEEKKRKQKEKEDTNEYRKIQMAKLYKMESLYKKEIIKRKNKNKNGMKNNNIKNNKEKIQNINGNNNKNTININKIEAENKIIKITREEYDNKLDSLIKQTRIYLNELEKLPIANKSNKIYEREIQLNKNIDEIQKQIKKY